ncbi:MAG TPA: hypothetical protein VEU29_00585 [Actinomycetota bacterium]|nr:hypothetical protein [Actinomycetota bacterium]
MLAAERILRRLGEHEVEYVLIGGFAATVHGSALRTEDVDVCPRRGASNLGRLAKALVALEAKEYDPGKGELVDRSWDADTLAADTTWILGTPFGRLDLVFQPAGTAGYDDLARSAVEVNLDGLVVRVASLEDVIRSKEAVNRPRDREQLPTLRRLLDLSGGE